MTWHDLKKFAVYYWYFQIGACPKRPVSNLIERRNLWKQTIILPERNIVGDRYTFLYEQDIFLFNLTLWWPNAKSDNNYNKLHTMLRYVIDIRTGVLYYTTCSVRRTAIHINWKYLVFRRQPELYICACAREVVGKSGLFFAYNITLLLERLPFHAIVMMNL